MTDTRRLPAPRAGYYFHHAATGLIPITPSWHGRTLFKPLGLHMPGLDPNDDDNWYHVLPDAIRSAGTRRRVNFLNHPHDHDDDFELTPYDLLRQRAWSLSHDAHPEWRRLFRRDEGHRLALPNPRPAVLMQGWVYALAGRDLRTAPMTHALMILSPGAARSMRLLLQDDAAIKRLLDVTTTRVLELYRDLHDFEPAEGWRVTHECERPTGEDKSAGGVRHLICRMLSPERGRYVPAPTARDHQHFRGWDTVVRRLTAKEQVRLLATALPPGLIAAAFADSRYAACLPRRLAAANG